MHLFQSVIKWHRIRIIYVSEKIGDPMRGVVVTKVGVEKRKNNSLNLFRKYLYKPLTGGIFGYLVFLVLISVSKYFGYLIGNRESFQIDITDLLLSLLGFAFIFTIKMKENTKGKIS